MKASKFALEWPLRLVGVSLLSLLLSGLSDKGRRYNLNIRLTVSQLMAKPH